LKSAAQSVDLRNSRRVPNDTKYKQNGLRKQSRIDIVFLQQWVAEHQSSEPLVQGWM